MNAWVNVLILKILKHLIDSSITLFHCLPPPNFYFIFLREKPRWKLQPLLQRYSKGSYKGIKIEMCLVGGQLPIWQSSGHFTAFKGLYWNWEAGDLRHSLFYCYLSVLDFSLRTQAFINTILSIPNSYTNTINEINLIIPQKI